MITDNKFYLFNKLKEKRVPLHVQMELTAKCNHNCLHCIRQRDIKKELKAQEIKRILGELADSGCLQLTFTGGEPLLRKDFFEICDFAKAKNFTLRLFTNGSLINHSIIEKLKKIKFKEIKLPLFSVNPQAHDAITRTPGSLRKALQAIKLLEINNIPFRVSSVIMRNNIQELGNLKKLAKQKGWRFNYDSIIYPAYSGSNFPLVNRVRDKDVYFLKHRRLLACVRYKSRESKINELKCFYQGNLHCYISVEGKVFPHATVRLLAGDLRKETFREIWDNSLQLNRLRALKPEDFDCFHCGSFLDCPWELGLAFAEQERITARPKEYCRIENILRKEE